MKLSRAYLCGNCESVGQNARFCEDCGSSAVENLAKLLDGRGQTESDRTVQDLIESSKDGGCK